MAKKKDLRITGKIGYLTEDNELITLKGFNNMPLDKFNKTVLGETVKIKEGLEINEIFFLKRKKFNKIG